MIVYTKRTVETDGEPRIKLVRLTGYSWGGSVVFPNGLAFNVVGTPESGSHSWRHNFPADGEHDFVPIADPTLESRLNAAVQDTEALARIAWS